MTTALASPVAGVRPAGRPDPRRAHDLHRARLDNGLRVVLLPDPLAPAVGIAVSYDVGYRNEARSGFAHLFEHLMFQGSPNLPAQEHARLVQANGGTFNGITNRDYTCYHEVLPAEALELGLFLEADRMRGTAVTEANLATQVSVVTEEINRTIRNRPYGGFPTFTLPPALFADHANAHDGYGDVASLAAATVAECAEFFDTWYAPGCAVLAVCGRFDVADALALVERHFGGIPARTAARPAATAAVLAGQRHREGTDPLAPVPALAMGWPLPAPTSPEYLASILVAAVLSAGDTSRLKRRLVREAALATQVMAFAGLTGPFEARDADIFVATAMCAAGTAPDTVAAQISTELDALATDGVRPDELRRALRWMQSIWYRDLDSVGARAGKLSAYELLHADPALALDAPARLSTVDGDQVRAAAAVLGGTEPATVHVLPKGAPR